MRHTAEGFEQILLLLVRLCIHGVLNMFSRCMLLQMGDKIFHHRIRNNDAGAFSNDEVEYHNNHETTSKTDENISFNATE